MGVMTAAAAAGLIDAQIGSLQRQGLYEYRRQDAILGQESYKERKTSKTEELISGGHVYFEVPASDYCFDCGTFELELEAKILVGSAAPNATYLDRVGGVLAGRKVFPLPESVQSGNAASQQMRTALLDPLCLIRDWEINYSGNAQTYYEIDDRYDTWAERMMMVQMFNRVDLGAFTPVATSTDQLITHPDVQTSLLKFPLTGTRSIKIRIPIKDIFRMRRGKLFYRGDLKIRINFSDFNKDSEGLQALIRNDLVTYTNTGSVNITLQSAHLVFTALNKEGRLVQVKAAFEDSLQLAKIEPYTAILRRTGEQAVSGVSQKLEITSLFNEPFGVLLISRPRNTELTKANNVDKLKVHKKGKFNYITEYSGLRLEYGGKEWPIVKRENTFDGLDLSDNLNQASMANFYNCIDPAWSRYLRERYGSSFHSEWNWLQNLCCPCFKPFFQGRDFRLLSHTTGPDTRSNLTLRFTPKDSNGHEVADAEFWMIPLVNKASSGNDSANVYENRVPVQPIPLASSLGIVAATALSA